MKNNIWFINFNGIGNGIIVAPILACFEKTYPSIKYFHTENEVLANPWFQYKARINGPTGYNPLTWRRFKKENWQDIVNFINENNIETIVNLRNEGPGYDVDYYDFKHFFKEKNVNYFELNFPEITNRLTQQNLTSDILSLFNKLGVNTTEYNHEWLKDDLVIKEERVGFGMTASHSNKKLPLNKWFDIARELSNIDVKISLFPGLDEKEKNEANIIKERLVNNIVIIKDFSLEEAVKEMSKLKLFISNDTGLLHAAVASGIPTIGLYIATDPNIWAPLNQESFIAIKNKNFKRCPYLKLHCGNCLHYNDICPAISQFGDGISVKKVIESAIKLVPILDK